MSVAQALPIGFFFLYFLETSAIGFAKITCNQKNTEIYIYMYYKYIYIYLCVRVSVCVQE